MSCSGVSSPRQSFVSPMVPFSGTILGGLAPGEMLLIQGSVPTDVDRFQVDLTCGSSVSPRADVAFHLNPRVKKKCVVCNSLVQERWGREEIHKVMPLRPGEAFEMLILVLSHQYKVAVNGAHLVEYKHRVDLRRVDTLLIQGKVHIQTIAVLPSQTAVLRPEPQSRSPNTAPALCSKGDLMVPFRADIDKGLSPGRSITIRGRTTPNAQSLCLNLEVGGTSNIALHLNPRLKEQTFSRNSFLFNCWGPEETEIQDFPLGPDQYFEMIVQVDLGQFRVALNGSHQFSYKHRVQDLSCINALQVSGDLRLEEVRLL
ncbi:unnamed protein product [Knipowitschia caucasica]